LPKTILITGAGTGFGHDTAETLSRAGHTVFASMREPQAKNREPAATLREQGIEVIELDVSSDASVHRAVKKVLARVGRINVLINNAGVASAGVTEAFTPDQAKIVFNTNVVGLLRTTRAVLPAMRRQGDGLIINLGSILGRVTFPFFGIYGASKFAIEALTDSLRYEVSQLGIDVTLVQPSAYPTPMYASVQQPADAARVASSRFLMRKSNGPRRSAFHTMPAPGTGRRQSWTISSCHFLATGTGSPLKLTSS
jgi:NAD(P)-dependent dehydrogenase (short-subunit alcohol dehydrogenase family)